MQCYSQFAWLCQLVSSIGYIINLLIPIIIALTVLIFFWGLFKYVLGGGDKEKSDGKGILIAGIIALFVEVSIWGIIHLLATTVGIPQASTGVAPSVQSTTSAVPGSLNY